MSTVGYYITCDDAICDECAPAGFADGDYSFWDGFEDWDEPIAISSGDELDAPTHCVDCEALIAHQLTSVGYEYVADAIERGVRDGDGRHCIHRAWWEQYGAEIDDDRVRDIVTAMAEKWPERDEYSPTPTS